MNRINKKLAKEINYNIMKSTQVSEIKAKPANYTYRVYIREYLRNDDVSIGFGVFRLDKESEINCGGNFNFDASFGDEFLKYIGNKIVSDYMRQIASAHPVNSPMPKTKIKIESIEKPRKLESLIESEQKEDFYCKVEISKEPKENHRSLNLHELLKLNKIVKSLLYNEQFMRVMK